jgi:hypothetical protein
MLDKELVGMEQQRRQLVKVIEAKKKAVEAMKRGVKDE